MSENKIEKERRKRGLALIIILSVGIVICTAVTLWAVFFRGNDGPVLTPDYAPADTEPNAEPVTGDDSKLDVPSGGGGISIEYISRVDIDLSENKATFKYTHPARSTQNIVLQIVVKDTIIAQSGLIVPGNQLRELSLLKGMAEKLSPGTYTDAQFRVLSYDPESGEKAMVDTVAEITVVVKE